MKRPKFLVPLILNGALLPKSIRATVFLCEEILGAFGRRKLDVEKVGYPVEGGN